MILEIVKFPKKRPILGIIPKNNTYLGHIPRGVMATKQQIAQIVQLRGTGHSLEEIAAIVGLSKSTVAYQLQKLKEKSAKTTMSDVFTGALIGAAGAAGGIALALLLEQLTKE